MKKLQFSIDIKAPREKIWNALWDDTNYREWSSAFSEGSRAVTDWKKGSRVMFLDGKNDGMYSMVAENIPNKQMSFKHLGEIKDGKEQPIDEKTKKWSGSMENYTLEEKGSSTRLLVDLDAYEEWESMFNDHFPKALEKVKEIAEK